MDERDHLFKALSDPARIRIIEFLHRPDATCCTVEDRVCASDLEGLLGLSQPAVSHHVKVLVQAGLVLAEKCGRFTCYRVNRPRFAELQRYLASFAGEFLEISVARRSAAPRRPSAN
ncbi:MAG: winged helix-turn-helix transcriptional regulator [Proteobacteria bacterium]|nr:winged helix-turn-helix transcriptional regulator [Pseudomonadota bacterium]